MPAYIAITDAHQSIGHGHAARQISLAVQAVQAGIDALILSTSPVVKAMCLNAGVPFRLFDSPAEIEKYVLSAEISGLVIDVHQRDFNQFRALCDRISPSLLIVSDVGCAFEPFGTFMVLIGSHLREWTHHESIDRFARRTEIFSGRAWMLFRDEFCNQGNIDRGPFKRILIAHGGSDPFNLTEKSLRALEQTLNSWKVAVLATETFGNLDGIRRLVSTSKHDCELIINTPCVSNMMRRSDIAIINGGNVRYELCMTGTPFVAISFSPLQYQCTQQLVDLGAGVNLGVMDKVSDSDLARSVETLLSNDGARASMGAIMRKLFDCNGGNRLLALISGEPHE